LLHFTPLFSIFVNNFPTGSQIEWINAIISRPENSNGCYVSGSKTDHLWYFAGTGRDPSLREHFRYNVGTGRDLSLRG
jgi:hypothetical protein